MKISKTKTKLIIEENNTVNVILGFILMILLGFYPIASIISSSARFGFKIHGADWIIMFACLMLAVLFLHKIFHSPNIKIMLDKEENRLYLEEQMLFFKVKRNYEITDISNVKTETSATWFFGGIYKISNIFFILKTGKNIPLTTYWSFDKTKIFQIEIETKRFLFGNSNREGFSS